MSVTVNLHPAFIGVAMKGQKTLKANGKTVGDVINDIERSYPGFKDRIVDTDGQLMRMLDIYVNDTSTYPEDLAKKVKDGDQIFIVTLLEGG
jgi:sulfur-carrier protein